ncbi:MAG: alpha/beta hydrolase family protein [Acidimicrobiales bacterium]
MAASVLAGAGGASMSNASAATPAPGSPAYIQRDVQNMMNAFGRELAPGGELVDPAYARALGPAMLSSYLAQVQLQLSHPFRPAVTGANLVPGWNTGNAYRTSWAGTRGREIPVQFTADDGALLQGDVFAPLADAHDPYTGAALSPPYPGVVIVTGSIQASSNLYSWLAEDLAERGYVVLTFDVQGQGRSETLPGNGTLSGVPSEQQSNFDTDAEDAITFLLSTTAHPYPNPYAGTTAVTPANPLGDEVQHLPDPSPGVAARDVAVIGHSTGAVTVSYLQGVDPRIAAAVALDKITVTPNAIADDQAVLGSLPGPVVPTVPTLGVQSEYGFEPQPYFEASCSSFEPCPAAPGGTVGAPQLHKAPDPNREEATGFDAFVKAGVDSMVVVPRASTHLDYTDEPPVLPASAWGQAMASYYVQAWLDKYLKNDPTADSRLLSPTIDYLEPVGNGVWRPVTIDRDSHLSFYFCSGYAFHLADGQLASDTDIVHDGCP